jgi:hypothetical protein
MNTKTRVTQNEEHHFQLDDGAPGEVRRLSSDSNVNVTQNAKSGWAVRTPGRGWLASVFEDMRIPSSPLHEF